MNTIILEDGYNTDYIYSLIIAIFHNKGNAYQLLNNDCNNSNTYYLQEYIKHKILDKINNKISITTEVINKLRMFLYNSGWLKDTEKYIFDKCDINEFYIFLVSQMLENKIICSHIDTKKNISIKKTFDLIELNDNHFNDHNNLSFALNNWIDNNYDETYFKFEEIPIFIPIYINLTNPIIINIMESINFTKNYDKTQKTLVWDFESLICYDNENKYYYVVKQWDYNNFCIFSDKQIPSQYKVCIDDKDKIYKIAKSIKFVIYNIS